MGVLCGVVVDEGERESMERRLELGAGIGAVVLGVIGVLGLMFAPILAQCTSGQVRGCPQHNIRYASLVQVHADVSVWIFIIGMLVVVLIGAAGAIAEAGFRLRGGVIPLWSGAVMAIAGCLIVQGIGIFYFPAILALAVAAGSSLMRQRALVRSARGPIPDELPPDEAERQPDSGT